MRGMLGVRESQYELGSDADGLEARMEAHFTFKYPGGKEYAASLVGQKPNDVHTLNAKKLNLSRDDAKTMKYGITYGSQPPKIAKSFGWTLTHAKKVFNEFWDGAPALKALKTALTAHWEAQQKKCIIGIDGRRLPSRAQHSLLNLLFQSSGSISMKRAMVFHYQWLSQENLLGNPFKENLDISKKSAIIISMHDELQQSVHKDLVRVKTFTSKEEAEKFIQDNNRFIFSDIVKETEDSYKLYWSKVGELVVKSLLAAGEYYKLNIPLTSGYQCGKNWGDCH